MKICVFFLLVAEECKNLHNFSSACALFAGIDSALITCLKRTYTLDKPTTKISASIKKLMSPQSNFQAYRKAINNTKTPSAIPLLRVHLKDIRAVYDGRISLGPDIINFELYYRLYGMTKDLLSHWQPSSPDDRTPSENPADDVRVFIGNQLRSLSVDDKLRGWLQDRSKQLERNELADYHSHRSELMATGFIRSH